MESKLFKAIWLPNINKITREKVTTIIVKVSVSVDDVLSMGICYKTCYQLKQTVGIDYIRARY